MFCAPVMLLSLSLPSAPDTEPKPFHPTAVGTKWVYQNDDREQTVVLETVEKQGTRTVVTLVEHLKGDETHPYETMAIAGNGLFRVDVIGLKGKQPMCLLQLPPKAGDKWEIPLADKPLGPMTVSTIALEEVTVPAGTYKAWRVEANFPGKPIGTCWFAPGVGLVKSTWSGGKQELRSFSPGK
jgi:hypothetical protein